MTDEEFLAYCERRAQASECSLTSDQVARLARLAGQEPKAQVWESMPPGEADCDPDEIWLDVQTARERLAAEKVVPFRRLDEEG